jgi:hypothetical protein
MVKRTNDELWKKIKDKWLMGEKGGTANKWNARKAQLAVLEYKKKGGGYIGEKKKDNSLSRWTREDWNYINEGKKSGRYLPKKVRLKLTDSQKKRENKLKGYRKGEKVPYTEATKKIMREYEII